MTRIQPIRLLKGDIGDSYIQSRAGYAPSDIWQPRGLDRKVDL